MARPQRLGPVPEHGQVPDPLPGRGLVLARAAQLGDGPDHRHAGQPVRPRRGQQPAAPPRAAPAGWPRRRAAWPRPPAGWARSPPARRAAAPARGRSRPPGASAPGAPAARPCGCGARAPRPAPAPGGPGRRPPARPRPDGGPRPARGSAGSPPAATRGCRARSARGGVRDAPEPPAQRPRPGGAEREPAGGELVEHHPQRRRGRCADRCGRPRTCSGERYGAEPMGRRYSSARRSGIVGVVRQPEVDEHRRPVRPDDARSRA